MADEYLWDRTGEPDPEIVRLEGLLAGYRYTAPKKNPLPRAYIFLAVAATLVLVAGLVYWLQSEVASEWQIAGKPVAVGQTIETKDNGGAKLEAEFVGEVTLDANSRLRVLPSTKGNQQLALQRGTMHALIWAPPSHFVVETPSAKTIDLGCAYTLTVLQDDSGLLTVQTGWVAFQAGNLESFIPAGAACHTRPRLGPGLPYFEESPQAFRDALARYEDTEGREGLNGVLTNARKEDALTLWHLVLRTNGGVRDVVAERFASLVPGTDIAGLKARQGAAVDQAWNLLGLGGADWWRMWKHDWQ